MVNQTILVNIRATIKTSSEEMYRFINELYSNNEQPPWFCAKDGKQLFFREREFFSEFRRDWNESLVSSCQQNFDDYFNSLNWNKNISDYPTVEILETYEGSWIIEAALMVAATVSTTYVIIKGVSEIPNIIEGIQKLKEKISSRFQRDVNQKAMKRIARNTTPQLSDNFNIIRTDVIIDTRPLEGLSPIDLCEHTIHLKVNITSSGIVIENLSDKAMKNIRIGLFNNQTEMHRWNLADAYIKNVVSLSGHQTTAIEFTDFKNDGKAFAIHRDYLRLDCWVQDNTGIYLFNFILPEE